MARKKEKPGVMFYWDMFDALEILKDGQAKTMLKAIRQYSQDGLLPDFENDAVLSVLWAMMKPKVDADTERYEKIREQRTAAVNARWAKEKENEPAQEDTAVYGSIQEDTAVYESIRNMPNTETNTETNTNTTTTTETDPYTEVMELFNNVTRHFSPVKRLSEGMMASIDETLMKYTHEELQEAFERADRSNFLKGKNNRNWQATFDWLIKAENVAKVLNGNYDNRETAATAEKHKTFDDIWGN